MPRRGEEQPESITGFHHIYEDTWSGKGGGGLGGWRKSPVSGGLEMSLYMLNFPGLEQRRW